MKPIISAIEKSPKTDGLQSIQLSSVQLIFSNIQQIYKVNSQFLMELDDRVADWNPEQTLGDLFSDVVCLFFPAPFLPLYSPFCLLFVLYITLSPSLYVPCLSLT